MKRAETRAVKSDEGAIKGFYYLLSLSKVAQPSGKFLIESNAVFLEARKKLRSDFTESFSLLKERCQRLGARRGEDACAEEEEVDALMDRLALVSSLRSTAIHQAIILSVSGFIKNVSNWAAKITGEKAHCFYVLSRTPEAKHSWAAGVIAAGNYVRHSEEWPKYIPNMNSKAPTKKRYLSRIERHSGVNARRNVEVLLDLGITAKNLFSELHDVSTELVEALHLDQPQICSLHFEEWRLAVNSYVLENLKSRAANGERFGPKTWKLLRSAGLSQRSRDILDPPSLRS